MMKKKLLCMLLSITMVFTVMDIPASASEVQEITETGENATAEDTESREDGPTQTEKTEVHTSVQTETAEEPAPVQTETAEDPAPVQTETAEEDKSEGTILEAASENDTTEEHSSENSPETSQPESETDNNSTDQTQPETEIESSDETQSTEIEEETASEIEEETVSETEEETASETEEAAADTNLQSVRHTADEIREFIEQEKAAKTDATAYKTIPVSQAPYSSGSLSDATLDSAAAMVRQIRFIAGLPYDVSVNDQYSQLSQSAALLSYVNGALSDVPAQPEDMAEELFRQGREGIAHSNIAFSEEQTQTLNAVIIDTWMAERDSLSTLPNRMRILDSRMEQIGFGVVKGEKGTFSAMYTAESTEDIENPLRIAWPAQNMPVEYFDTQSPWSVSTGDIIDASDICVILTRESDKKEWSFSADGSDGVFHVENDSLAQQSYIMFRPDTAAISEYTDGDSFQIEITNGGKAYISYSVNFFSLSTEETSTQYTATFASDDGSVSEPVDLSAEQTDAQIKDIKPAVYNGKPYEPKVTVSIFKDSKRVTLKKDKDYTLKYQNNINAGVDTASVTVTGIGDYKGNVTKTFTITPKSMKKLKVITESKYIKDSTTNIYVYDGNVLVNYKTYTVQYHVDPKDEMKVTAEITANENTNYTGTVTAKLTVYDVPPENLITKGSVSMTGNTVYTGKPITRDITLKSKTGVELQPNKDYSVKYQNNTNVGTATVTITGKGSYKGTIVRTFGITKADVHNKEHMVITDIPAKIFNGKEQKPAVTVKTTSNKKLALNKDYTVTYSHNIHSGTATVQIKGIGNNCNGSTSTTFEIQPQEIKKASVKATKATDKTPSKIVLKYSNKELQEYTDYMVTSYEELKNKKVKVTIKGLGDFKGEVIKTLKTEIPPEEPNAGPVSSNNLNKNNYLNFKGYGLEESSNLFQNDDGTLTRVEYVNGKGVYVERYTADYQFIAREQFIKTELPIFGGFYATKDNYFLVFGQKNPKNDDNMEVIRFVKYDKDWNRLGDARLFGINTAEPFIFSSVRMVDKDGVLYVRTGHNMYDGHQANMAFSINIADMKFINQFYTLGGPAIASHSLNQYITLAEPYLITADHGDAYPRGIILSKHTKGGATDTYFTSQKSAQSITALKLGGSAPSNVTGASVGGLEASDTSYLVVGNSVDQTPELYNPKGILNIYVSSTPKDNFTNEAVKVHWITDFKYLEYTDANGELQKTPEASVCTPQLVKLNGNEMMLLWTQVTTVIENNKPQNTTDVKCVLLNGAGEPISGIYSLEGGISDCRPILVDGKIVWYYTKNSAPIFCTLDPEDVRKQPR